MNAAKIPANAANERLADMAMNQRRADLMTFVAPVATEDCPGCRLNWSLFPPAKIDGFPTLHRCVECKRVYEFVAQLVDERG